MENIDFWTEKIHKNAVDHGWWASPRPFGEVCALIHSELSEALEAYRDGKPEFYREPEGDPHGKPEGTAVELADAVIRILDYAGAARLDIDPYAEDSFGEDFDSDCFGDFIARCHADVTDAYLCDRDDERADVTDALSRCVARIERWFRFWTVQSGIDLEAVIAAKHEYNRGRPYRHGGKIL